MKRDQHNLYYSVERQPDERVHCNLIGYGELSQYDSECSWCWLGYEHTWDQHDESIGGLTPLAVDEACTCGLSNDDFHPESWHKGDCPKNRLATNSNRWVDWSLNVEKLAN